MSTTTQTQTATQRVASYLKDSAGITWDNCHKIYILMDKNQVEVSKGFDYEVLTDLTPKEKMKLIKEWYANSCGLQFVTVFSTDENGNDDFITVVKQGEKWRVR